MYYVYIQIWINAYKKIILTFPRFLRMLTLDNILFKGNYVIILRVIRGILCD